MISSSLTILVGLPIVHGGRDHAQSAIYLGVVVRDLGGKLQRGMGERRPLSGEVETEVEATYKRLTRAELEDRDQTGVLEHR